MRIVINTKAKRYPVIIGANAIRDFRFPDSAVVITNTTLHRLYGKWFRRYPVIEIPTGESHKRLQTIEHICEQLIRLGADRSTSIIACGGGVVGDMAGFVASIFMRGIPVYQVPTTLLAMVDASVGGKTGVDSALGKNLIGTFHQPEAVIIDPLVLTKLPLKEFNNGMAEVVKHGVLDASLFTWLESNVKNIQQRDVKILETLLVKNVRLKKAIVEQDEKESDVRMLLNLGHTFGHAIEYLSGYTIPHGQAVAIGLVYSAYFANMPEVNRLVELLQAFNLPTRLETRDLKTQYSGSAMVKVMKTDKKNQAGGITLVLPRELGKIHIHSKTSPTSIERFLNKYHAEVS